LLVNKKEKKIIKNYRELLLKITPKKLKKKRFGGIHLFFEIEVGKLI
jgi:hypothetical protein